MRKFLVLLKVSVKSMLLTTSGKSRGKRKKSTSGMGAAVLIALLGLYLSGLYSSILLGALAPVHMEVLLFIFMGIGALVGGLLFTTFAVKGVVFGGKDNDLLLSMPVPATMLMASRVTAIYLENLLFSFFVLVPAGVVCSIMTESGVGRQLLFWVRLLIAVLTLPLLDTALSVLLGALVAFVSSKMSKGALGQHLVMAVYFVAIFWLSFHLNDLLESLTADAAGVKSSMTWAAPLVWMGDGILGNWGLLLAFVGCCILAFALVVWILGRVYRRAVTAFQSRSVGKNYKLSAQSASGRTRALLGKETKRFFGTPMYFWNAGMGLVFLLVLSILAVIQSGSLRELLTLFGDGFPTLAVAAAVVAFLLSTCVISAPSFSLEGRYLWILREAPVEEKTLVWVKTGFQLLLTLPCTLIASVCLSFALVLPLWQGVVLLVSTALFALGQACFGTLMGLTFPKLDAANETVVVKQSLAVVLAMIVPMAALLLCWPLYWLGGLFNPMAALLLPIVLIGVLTVVCAALLAKRGPEMVREL